MARSKEIVHKTMAAIKGKDTGLEKAIRARLHEKGLFYLKNSSRITGHPDLFFPSARLAVFLDSEFWHGYNYEEAIAKVKTNRPFWEAKIQRNIARDKEVNETLAKQGYKVLRYWGKEILDDPDRVANEITASVLLRRKMMERTIGITEKTTLAYIESEGCYLLLYRNKKKNDENQGKWVGIGGHLEDGENYIQAMKREIYEETGLEVTSYRYYGSVDFLNMDHPGQRMYLFKVTGFSGQIKECNEGELAWIDKKKMLDLPMWEGDKLFLDLLDDPKPETFRLLIYYGEDGLLIDSIGPFVTKKV